MTPPILPENLSGEEVRRALERAGFKIERRQSGHMSLHLTVVYRALFVPEYKSIPGKTVHLTVIIPDHQHIRVGALRKILHAADVSYEEFLSNL